MAVVGEKIEIKKKKELELYNIWDTELSDRLIKV